ncbi:MAG TPA: TldD/PmbA family protein [Hellea balneolensis]|uniref:TldD/PmbA family protein n=1 Tax=Hellea balneolensis TaxID=287478 RepID=A0A7C5QQD1_9PROT|nr:TldD/PmbA family protein [Hellea balneolensis]
MKTIEQTAPKPEHLKGALEHLITLAKAHGAEQADAVAAHARSLSVGVRGGALEDVDNSEGRDIGLRVMIGKRQACVSSSDLSTASLEALAERACAMAKLAPEDPHIGLADPSLLAKSKPELDIIDTQAAPMADDLLVRAKEIEAAALAVPGVKQAEGASAYVAGTAVYLLTSHGFSKGWQSTRHGQSVSAIAEQDGALERDYDYHSTRHLLDLKTTAYLGQRAGERAVARLGSKKMASGSMPVMFERRIAGSLLSSFVSAISGPSITRGVSFLKDALHSQVFAKNVQITDDPFIKRGMGSRPWDGEGVQLGATKLIEDGVLKTWLLNTATAHKLGMSTTGHATRSIGAPPGVASTNVYIHAGDTSPENMMADIGKGLLVCEMFGPSINPNTGDYSVGVSGYAIENGKRAYPVSEITIASNLKDMFSILRPCDDLIFEQATTAPTLMVPEMVIAGE